MSDHLLAILSYHKLGPPGSEAWDTWYYVQEASFVEHLEHLTDEGWQFLDLTDFLDGLKFPAKLPERGALLTFDDGYSSVARVALPRLVEFGIPGVMFVPTAYIGATNEFDLNAYEARSRSAAGISSSCRSGTASPCSHTASLTGASPT